MYGKHVVNGEAAGSTCLLDMLGMLQCKPLQAVVYNGWNP